MTFLPKTTYRYTLFVDDINTARDAKEGTHACRVGQNCSYTPYMTVYLMTFLQKITYIQRLWMILTQPGMQKRAHTCRVGQNSSFTPYMTVCLMISLQKIPYIHRICMVLASPTHTHTRTHTHTHMLGVSLTL